MSKFDAADTAKALADLYEREFGGKARGRFRISMKHLRRLTGRKRVHPDEVAALQKALYELGFVMVDLETFFVVLNQKTFASYRRVNEASLGLEPGQGGDSEED